MRIGIGKIFAVAGGLALSATAAGAATYSGNGAGGFGGSIGNSTLTVTDGGSTINFSLATSGFGDSLAVYIDSVAGGFGSTATFVDTNTGDGGRRALSGSGDGGVTRSTVNFAAGFLADYGIAVRPGDFAGLFNLTPSLGSPTEFQYVNSANLNGASGATTVTWSVNKADIGLPASGGSFKFVATLLNPFDSGTTVFRSDETIGASTTVPAGNPGSLGTLTFTSANTFLVPEPTTIGVVAGAALVALRRRRLA